MLVIHHPIDYRDEQRSKQSGGIAKLKSKLIGDFGNATYFVIGRQGSGKGSLGYLLADVLVNREDGDLGQRFAFFATAHFTNDFHSLLDGARHRLEQFASENNWSVVPSDDQTPVRRFFSAFEACRGECIVVFGGIHRLLRTTSFSAVPQTPVQGATATLLDRLLRDVPVATPINPEIAEFLRQALDFPAIESGSDDNTRRRLVLTSAAVPDLLVKHPGADQIILEPQFDLPSVVAFDGSNGNRGNTLGMQAYHAPSCCGTVAARIRHFLTENAVLNRTRSMFTGDVIPVTGNTTEMLKRLVARHLFLADLVNKVHSTLLSVGKRGVWDSWLSDAELAAGSAVGPEGEDRLIQSLVKLLSGTGNLGPAWQHLGTVLERLSLFTTPVPATVLARALLAGWPDRHSPTPSNSYAALHDPETLNDFMQSVSKTTALALQGFWAQTLGIFETIKIQMVRLIRFRLAATIVGH
jgi:hypothetical protein